MIKLIENNATAQEWDNNNLAEGQLLQAARWASTDNALDVDTALEAVQVFMFCTLVAGYSHLADLYEELPYDDELQELVDEFNRQMRQAGSKRDLI